MDIMDTGKPSAPIYRACVIVASVAFAFLISPQLLPAQGQATETFFEAAVREASEEQPSPVEEQEEEPTNPFEQLAEAISRLFGGGN